MTENDSWCVITVTQIQVGDMISWRYTPWRRQVTGLVLKINSEPYLPTWVTVLMLPEKEKVVFEFFLTDIVSAIRGSKEIP
jgi:hypothetical protein